MHNLTLPIKLFQ